MRHIFIFLFINALYALLSVIVDIRTEKLIPRKTQKVKGVEVN